MSVNPYQIIVGTRATVNFFEISEPTLSRWHRAGCPKKARGQYDLKAVFKWFMENIVNGDGAGQACDDKNLREARALYWSNKAQLMEVHRKKAQEELYSKKDIHQQWAARLFLLCSSLENLADRLPPILYGKDPNAMWETIRNEVDEMRAVLCKGGVYCPKILDLPQPRTKPEKATRKKPKKRPGPGSGSTRRKTRPAARGDD